MDDERSTFKRAADAVSEVGKRLDKFFSTEDDGEEAGEADAVE